MKTKNKRRTDQTGIVKKKKKRKWWIVSVLHLVQWAACSVIGGSLEAPMSRLVSFTCHNCTHLKNGSVWTTWTTSLMILRSVLQTQLTVNSLFGPASYMSHTSPCWECRRGWLTCGKLFRCPCIGSKSQNAVEKLEIKFLFLVAGFLHENGEMISRMKQKVHHLDSRDAFQDTKKQT